MIPRLLDVAAFKAMANLSETEFSNFAALGMLPRAVGLYRGAAIWSDEHVGDFVRGTLKREPAEFDDASLPVVTSPAAVVAAPAASVAAVIDESKPAFHSAEFLNQLQAAEYMGVGTNWVAARARDGLLSATKQFGVMVYARKDLDALMTLPVYTLRKRKGFAAGKPVKENSAQKRQRIEREAHEARQVVTNPEAILSRKAAADFLGIHAEELAILEKDKLGPAYSGLGYRLSDLEAFKSQHLKKDTRGEPWTVDQTMSYLGVSRNTLATWGRNGTGPAFVSGVLNNHRQRLYDSNSVKAYKRENTKELEKIKRFADNARAMHLGDHAAAARAAKSRKRVAMKQKQAENTPKPRKAGAKVKASKSAAKGKAASPYVRNGTRPRVAGSASARA